MSDLLARPGLGPDLVDAFLVASFRDRTGRAVRLLAATPEIAGYDARTAVVTGRRRTGARPAQA